MWMHLGLKLLKVSAVEELAVWAGTELEIKSIGENHGGWRWIPVEAALVAEDIERRGPHIKV